MQTEKQTKLDYAAEIDCAIADGRVVLDYDISHSGTREYVAEIFDAVSGNTVYVTLPYADRESAENAALAVIAGMEGRKPQPFHDYTVNQTLLKSNLRYNREALCVLACVIAVAVPLLFAAALLITEGIGN